MGCSVVCAAAEVFTQTGVLVFARGADGSPGVGRARGPVAFPLFWTRLRPTISAHRKPWVDGGTFRKRPAAGDFVDGSTSDAGCSVCTRRVMMGISVRRLQRSEGREGDFAGTTWR